MVKWWFNSPYAAHEYRRGHMRGIMYLGELEASSLSKKQKINVKISTEYETIFMDESMDKILWSKYFIDVQGYKGFHNKLMQYNDNDDFLEKW